MLLSARYSRDLYHQELQYLYDYGEPVKVGDKETVEVLDFMSVVTEPWHHCILLPSRRWNPWLALSEGLWILAGRNDLAALSPFNTNIANFSDDGSSLYGAYGYRIYDQIDSLVDRLRRDNNDRRAVLAIWNPKDLTAVTKDPPCNDMVMFKLRNKRLHMTVINRSNDIHWGLFAVNLPTFSLLQVYLAARLGCGVGNQTHLSNSLHVYTNVPPAVKITERMIFEKPEDRPAYPTHGLAFTEREMKGLRHVNFAVQASSALNMDPMPRSSLLFFQFASKFLACYGQREIDPRLGAEFPEYADWILAGQMFQESTWRKSLDSLHIVNPKS